MQSGSRLAYSRLRNPRQTGFSRKTVWKKSTLHFDGKVWPRKNKKAKTPSDIEIMVKPSTLVILQPGQAEHKLA
jgi:hypothetical protein